MRVTNVPRKTDKLTINCVPTPGGFSVQNSEGTTICELNSATQEGLARQIAAMATELRDTGYEHARQAIRETLGISRDAAYRLDENQRGGPSR